MSAELDAFAHSVRRLAAETAPEKDSWRPGEHVDDSCERLSAGLQSLGWSELSDGGTHTLPFLATAALELGRAAASMYDIMGLLGGAPLIDGLAMYARPGRQVAIADPTGYRRATVTASTPVNIADSLGVHRVTAYQDIRPAQDARTRIAAWEAATVGYFAGLATHVVDLAIDHALGRTIFGRSLAHLDAVQQRLGDAATIATMLTLSARDGAHGPPALAHAATSTWTVMAHAHLVFGALGFTLEFPLQRYSRRTKALGAFTNSWLDQRTTHHTP